MPGTFKLPDLGCQFALEHERRDPRSSLKQTMSHQYEPLRLESLAAYLAEQGLVSDPATVKIKQLTGGVSNLALWVDWPGGAFVIKQALAQLAVEMEWHADVRRIIREAEAMEWLRERVGPPAIPALLHLDRQRMVLVMEAVMPPAEEYKSLLLNGDVSQELAKAFGRLLARIHSATTDDASRERFADTAMFEQLRLSPYLDAAAARNPDLADRLMSLREACLEDTHCLVHGDYSPKNVLVREGELILLDYEVAHFGNPAFDLGFALTHYLCKALHVPGRGQDLIAAARAFWAAYGERTTLPEGARAGLHLGAVMLSRMDGKSPLEYFTDPARQETVRHIARTALLENWVEIDNLIDAVEEELP